MPYQVQRNGNQFCVHRENSDGSMGEMVEGHCHPTEEEAVSDMRALYANVEDAAAKYFEMVGVKAVGDWDIDITALPYGVRDSDGQWFDSQTDTMPDNFPAPAIFYHHGVKPGAKEIDDKPVIIGKALSVEKKPDGLHIRAILDKTNEYARRVWDAVKDGIVAVSSDSIAHLARLEIGGKRIMYEKNRPGRIAVWPLAGVSLWDAIEGNIRPASRNAIALPAMKAIYRDAGLPFPEIGDTTGVSQADEKAQKRAEIEITLKKANSFLKKEKKRRNYHG